MTFQPAFFEISAQLIPVLFLAMVVEEKLQPDDDEASYQRVMRTWVVVLLFWAEVICLSVTAGAIRSLSGAGAIVGVCELFAGFLVVIPVIGKAIDAGTSRSMRFGHAIPGLLFIASVTIFAFALGF